MPTPSLLAEPSRPRASILGGCWMRGGGMEEIGKGGSFFGGWERL